VTKVRTIFSAERNLNKVGQRTLQRNLRKREVPNCPTFNNKLHSRQLQTSRHWLQSQTKIY